MSLLTNLVTYWKLDEASGARADSVGSSTLAENGGTIAGATGKINSAATFVRASSQYLSGGGTAVLQGGDTDFTVNFWFKLNDVGIVQAIISKDQTGSRSFAVYVDSFDQLSAYITEGGGFDSVQISGTALSAGTWYMGTFWHDSASNLIGLAVNAGTPSTAAHSTGYDVGSAPVCVGQNFGTNFFGGLVDEVGIWEPRVLSSQDRTDIYNGGSALPLGSFGGAATVSFAATAGDATLGASFTATAPGASSATIAATAAAATLSSSYTATSPASSSVTFSATTAAATLTSTYTAAGPGASSVTFAATAAAATLTSTYTCTGSGSPALVFRAFTSDLLGATGQADDVDEDLDPFGVDGRYSEEITS
jgi:hypothetical protein